MEYEWNVSGAGIAAEPGDVFTLGIELAGEVAPLAIAGDVEGQYDGGGLTINGNDRRYGDMDLAFRTYVTEPNQ